MKVLITGGAGFIGSHLSELLLKNKKISKVIVIDHLLDGSKKNLNNVLRDKKFNLIKADISNLKRDFDYEPKIEVEEGINKFVLWYKEFYKVN